MTEYIRIVEAHLHRNGMPKSRRIFQFQIFFFHLYAIIKQIHNQTAANLYAKIVKGECRRKRIHSFFFCRTAAYLIQRYHKPSEEQSNLFEIVLPNRSLSYLKIEVECNTKTLLNLLVELRGNWTT